MKAAGGFVIYTDGACSGNPGPGGWGAILVATEGRVRELGGGAALTTNNRMELTGAIEALRAIEGRPGTVALYTDSTYVISGISSWIQGWKRRGWVRKEGGPVANRDLWETLDLLAARAGLSWHHVRGHSGDPGNERCDSIAVAFSKQAPPDLFDGSLAGYDVELGSPKTEPVRERSGGGARASAPKGPAVYLSCLDGRLERHPTWAECEARVKGRRGARFKKVTSSAEEAAVLRGWGLP